MKQNCKADIQISTLIYAEKIYKIQIIKANMSSPEEFLGAMATFQKPRQNICLIFQH